MNFNKDKYLEKLFKFKEKDAKKEIESICKKIGFIPDHYTIMINTGGFSYTIEKIASDIYLSNMPICDVIRQKLFLLNTVLGTVLSFSNIMRINELIAREKSGSWAQDREKEKKDETITEIKRIVNEFYKNKK
jgi:hypothetical protein